MRCMRLAGRQFFPLDPPLHPEPPHTGHRPGGPRVRTPTRFLRPNPRRAASSGSGAIACVACDHGCVRCMILMYSVQFRDSILLGFTIKQRAARRGAPPSGPTLPWVPRRAGTRAASPVACRVAVQRTRAWRARPARVRPRARAVRRPAAPREAASRLVRGRGRG